MIRISFPVEKMVKGVFLVRLNRFLAKVSVGFKEALAHVPNSGRMLELLVPGAKVWLIEKKAAGRKTSYELAMVNYENSLVAIDSRLSNAIVRRALEMKYLHRLSGYGEIKPEYTYGASRFDFFLPGKPPCLIEVKSVTLVERGRARFPDAPTERGRKHLLELIAARENEFRCIIIFVVQRRDAQHFSPNDATDPEFGRALRLALKSGVEAYAYKCAVDPKGMTLLGEIPVVV
ncbi:DNA/RNA nuclease SfsA [Zhaonella formicivorans]|uniref:DNA/RNA nuclease SfsA n=1 Tax=Zhaonella formicivorans TaxID=2528593 RepID=UPI001D124C7E|nr:DNA/RNA nuclease SfsA [Zhaonella formicivorans]